MKIGQSSHKIYSNNIVNFQEYTTILNTYTKKSLETYWMYHVTWKKYDKDSKKVLRPTYTWNHSEQNSREFQLKSYQKDKYLASPL